MTKTNYSVPWIDATVKRLVKRDISFTFVLANKRNMMSRFVTSGSEHMFRIEHKFKLLKLKKSTAAAPQVHLRSNFVLISTTHAAVLFDSH